MRPPAIHTWRARERRSCVFRIRSTRSLGVALHPAHGRDEGRIDFNFTPCALQVKLGGLERAVAGI